MRIAFGSVIYRSALHYLKEFFKSLTVQTSQNFDLVLINDDIPEDVLWQELGEWFDFFKNRIHIYQPDGVDLKPYHLRIELLKRAKEWGYQLLVLGDCDDFFAENRVESYIVQYSSEYTFFYNELRNFTGDEIMPELPAVAENLGQILEQNFLGLSNTAVNLDYLPGEFIQSLYEGKTAIFDWYLFSRLMLNGARGKRIDNTYSYYRVYAGNIAGIGTMSMESLYKEREVKIQHYSLMEHYSEMYSELINKYASMEIVPKEEKKSFWWGQLK